MFVETTSPLAIGRETAFAFDLAGGAVALRGAGTVLAVWPTDASPFDCPGVKLGALRLTSASMKTYEKLVAAGDFQGNTDAPTRVINTGDDGLTKVYRSDRDPIVDDSLEAVPKPRRLTERVRLGMSRLPAMRQGRALTVLGVGVLLVGLGIAGYFMFLREEDTSTPPPSTDVAAPIVDAAVDPDPATTMELRDKQSDKRPTRRRDKPKWDPKALFPPKKPKR